MTEYLVSCSCMRLKVNVFKHVLAVMTPLLNVYVGKIHLRKRKKNRKDTSYTVGGTSWNNPLYMME
jgi:hypothetical protein